MFAALALAFLFIAIGSGSYWLFRERGPSDSESRSAEPPAPSATPDAPEAAPSVAASEPARTVDASEPAPDAGPEPLHLDIADGAFSPTFATDGRELFFHAGRSNAGRLLVANLDDNGQVSRVSAVLNEDARNYHPRVSPNGRLMAFDSDRDGERGVYVAERDGSSPQRVSGSGYAAVPSWSPDMKWLAFVRGEPNRPRVWNLWLRDLASGAVQRHTSFRSGQVWGASWFPDGRSLCYSHEDRLIISHLDSRDDIVIGSPRRGRLVRTPAVSPDGQRVVFQVFKDGVWLLDVKTRSMRRILDDPAAEEFSWTPDGRRIAYHSRRDGAWKIWVMSVPRST
jgi:Tol biopolymer transport system component